MTMKKLKIVLLILRLSLFSVAAFAPVHAMPIYQPDAMPSKAVMETCRAQHLRQAIEKTVSLPCYQARKVLGRWITFCNMAVRDCFDNRPHNYRRGYGFAVDLLPADVSAVFPKPFDIFRYSIAQAWDRADRAWRAGKLELVTPEAAQWHANRGRVVWVISKQWRHEAIVCPDSREYDTWRGPLIGQAGGAGCNGIMDITDPRAFGWRYWRGGIRFYLFDWRTE